MWGDGGCAAVMRGCTDADDNNLGGRRQFFIIRQHSPAAQVTTRPEHMLAVSNEAVQAHLMHTHTHVHTHTHNYTTHCVPKATPPHTHTPGPLLAAKLHLLD